MRTAFLVLITILALPVGARAEWQLFTRLGARQIADPNFALVSESNASFRAELGVGLDLSPHFGVELATALGGSTAPVFDHSAEAALMLTSLQGSGVVRAPLLSWLQLFGRGGVSVEFASLELRESGMDGVSELEVVPAFLGTGGLLVQLRPADESGREQMALEFSAEGGYLYAPWRTDFSSLRLEHDPGDEPLRPGTIPAGSLDLSGWLVQVGVALRF